MSRRLPIHFSGFVTHMALGLALLLAVALGFGALPAQAQSAYTQEDLDAMLAPIALYPDDLLGQILIATTYPEDVADARAYVDLHPSLTGALLAYQVSAAPWDDAVKSLAQFPSLLAMIDDQPDWTDAVGYAFLNQQPDVMRTVQRLRLRASRAGYLRTNSQQVVDINGNVISIGPVREGFYDVPYYDPNIVYGRWWWPNRQPYYWEPPARYRPSGYSVASGIFFGASVGIISSIFHPVRPDWRRRQVIVVGGNKPGSQWKWAARPQRPAPSNRPTRPNRPPTAKPVLRPAPQRPTPQRPTLAKPGAPHIRPAKPQPALPNKPQVQPQRPGQGGARPQQPQNRPQVQPRPEKPVVKPTVKPAVKPTAPVPPVTRPVQTRPVQTRPVQTRPIQTQPAQARPTPARPAVTQPRPAPVARPAPAARPQAGRPAPAAQPKQAERPAVQRAPNRPAQAQKAPPRSPDKPDDAKKNRRDQP